MAVDIDHEVSGTSRWFDLNRFGGKDEATPVRVLSKVRTADRDLYHCGCRPIVGCKREKSREVRHERQRLPATFDPFFINAPQACSLCLAQPPVFQYEYCIEQGGGERHYIKGFCCLECATGLLKKLEGKEAQEWAEEEAELQLDDLEVADLQKRRLATFGKSG